MALSEQISLVIQADFKGQPAFAGLNTAIDGAKAKIQDLNVSLAGLNKIDFLPLTSSIGDIGLKLVTATGFARTFADELDRVAATAGALNLGNLNLPGGGFGGGGGRGAAATRGAAAMGGPFTVLPGGTEAQQAAAEDVAARLVAVEDMMALQSTTRQNAASIVSKAIPLEQIPGGANDPLLAQAIANINAKRAGVVGFSEVSGADLASSRQVMAEYARLQKQASTPAAGTPAPIPIPPGTSDAQAASIAAINAQTAAEDDLIRRLGVTRPQARAILRGAAPGPGFLASSEGRALAGYAGEQVGVGGRLGYGLAGFGGGALAAGGIAVGGFMLAKTSADFQSAVAQAVAQYFGGTVQQGAQEANQLGAGILGFTGTGQSFYSPATIAKSIEPALAMFNRQAVIGALPALSALSQQNRAPDLANAVTWLTTFGQNTGLGRGATAAQLTAGLDLMSQAETMTSVAPGKITSALPTLFAGIKGTPISIQEAIGEFLTVAANRPGQPKVDVNQLVKLYQDIETHATVGAMKEAQKIGLPMGPGAIEVYGGIGPYLQAAQQKILAEAGGDPTKAKSIAALLFPQTGTQGGALQAYTALTAQGALGQSAGFADRLFAAGGQTGRVSAQLQQGVAQQASELMAHLNTDMIQLGGALNQTVTPALLHMANYALKNLETSIGSIVDWWNTHKPSGVPGPLTGPANVASQVGGFAGSPEAIRAINQAFLVSGGTPPALVSPGLQAQAVGFLVRTLGNLGGVPGAVGNLFSGAGAAASNITGGIATSLTGDTGPVYARVATPPVVDPMVIQRVSMLRGTAGIPPGAATAPAPGVSASPLGGGLLSAQERRIVADAIAQREAAFWAAANPPSALGGVGGAASALFPTPLFGGKALTAMQNAAALASVGGVASSLFAPPIAGGQAAQAAATKGLATDFATGLQPLLDRVTNAQLTNNPAALAAAVKAVDAYYKSNGTALGGMTALQVQNAILQENQLLGTTTRLPGPQLIRPSGAGLGSIGEAGFGSAVATLVGGPANAQARTIALLEQQVRHLSEALNESRQEVYLLRQSSTSLASIDKKTPHPASHTTTHPRRGVPRPHGARR